MPQFDVYSFFAQGISILSVAFVFSFFVQEFFFKIPLVLKARKLYSSKKSGELVGERFSFLIRSLMVSLTFVTFFSRFSMLFLSSFRAIISRVRFTLFKSFFFKPFLVKSTSLVSSSSSLRFFVLGKKIF